MHRWINEAPRQVPWSNYTLKETSKGSEGSNIPEEDGGQEILDLDCVQFEENQAWGLDKSERFPSRL